MGEWIVLNKWFSELKQIGLVCGCGGGGGDDDVLQCIDLDRVWCTIENQCHAIQINARQQIHHLHHHHHNRKQLQRLCARVGMWGVRFVVC